MLGLDAVRVFLLGILDRRLLSASLSLSSDRRAIMSLIPCPERRGIDLHHGASGQSVGSHKFVVGRVEGDHDHTGLAGDTLGAPGEVARVETETTEFLVAATGAHEMDAFSADTRVGWLTTFLEGSVHGYVLAIVPDDLCACAVTTGRQKVQYNIAWP